MYFDCHISKFKIPKKGFVKTMKSEASLNGAPKFQFETSYCSPHTKTSITLKRAMATNQYFPNTQ